MASHNQLHESFSTKYGNYAIDCDFAVKEIHTPWKTQCSKTLF